jgi:hypothetical protein
VLIQRCDQVQEKKLSGCIIIPSRSGCVVNEYPETLGKETTVWPLQNQYDAIGVSSSIFVLPDYYQFM